MAGDARTNVVLVHGAWVDGSSWGEVITTLQEAGHRVIAVQLPLTSLADDIAATRNAMDALEGPTVLAGHSYGGTVISGAAANAPNVVGLVYVAALMNEVGESVNDITGRFPATDIGPTVRTNAGGKLTVDLDAFPDVFATGVEPKLARLLAAVQKPLTPACFDAKAEQAAWHNLPTWYVLSEGDRVVNPEAQRFLAERAGSTVVSIPAGHASSAQMPQPIATAIMDAAKGGTAHK